MTSTRIAGPLDERHTGAIHALVRTMSYAHRIRAIARTAAETPTVAPVRGNRAVSGNVVGCGCVVVPEGPTGRRIANHVLCPHTPKLS